MTVSKTEVPVPVPSLLMLINVIISVSDPHSGIRIQKVNKAEIKVPVRIFQKSLLLLFQLTRPCSYRFLFLTFLKNDSSNLEFVKNSFFTKIIYQFFLINFFSLYHDLNSDFGAQRGLDPDPHTNKCGSEALIINMINDQTQGVDSLHTHKV